MKTGILAAFIIFSLASFNISKPVDLVRDTYKKAINEAKSVKELKKLTQKKSDAQSIGFYGMALAFEARESSWLPTKLSLAKDAYAQLNKAITVNPNNFEVRYLRFSFSCEVPSFLGFNDHISEDKKYILDHAKKGEYLADIMKKYFQKSSCLTDKEKQLINTRL